MLQPSVQLRIVKSCGISFKRNKKTHLKLSSEELTYYVKFYNPEKFISWAKNDFLLLNLFIHLENNFTVRDVLDYLNNTSISDLRKILFKKDDILAYKNVIQDDIKVISKYTENIQIINNLYQHNKITFLGMYWYIFNHPEQSNTRIYSKKLKRIETFLEYFTSIKEYIESIESIENLEK